MPAEVPNINYLKGKHGEIVYAGGQ